MSKMSHFGRGLACWGERGHDQLLLGHDTPPQVGVNAKGVLSHFSVPMTGSSGM